jgi:hypothetical protein
LEQHHAELIDNEMKKIGWQYGHWKSDKNQVGYHWTRFGGKTDEEIIENGFDWLLPIWDTFKQKYNFEEPIFSFSQGIGISEIAKIPKQYSKYWINNYFITSLNGRSLYRVNFDDDFKPKIFP